MPKTEWWTKKRLRKQGYVFYTGPGEFVEDLAKIGSLLGSSLYELLSLSDGHYIRRTG